jgi:metabotropic glutamate receptor 1
MLPILFKNHDLTQFVIYFCVLILVIFCQNSFCVYKRKKIVQHGEIMIGALIPVHEQPSFKDMGELEGGSKRKCGVIRDQYGVQRVEALLFLLDMLNNKSINLLPGITLGIEIRDECWDSSIALEETIDFIKDTISSDNSEPEKIFGRGNFSQVSYNNPFLSSNQTEMAEKCNLLNSYYFSNYMNGNNIRNKQAQNRISAVIGPAGSTVSINVQNLLQLFDIPQVGYSATSRDLSDKKMFKTFLRVVPSDYLQVKAMIDVVQKMNWTYLFAIYTDGSYGQAGMEAFRNETSYLNICLAMYEKIREYASEEDYENVIVKMNQTSNANVIVCFCYGETIRGLLGAIKKLGLKGRFVILGRYILSILKNKSKFFTLIFF